MKILKAQESRELIKSVDPMIEPDNYNSMSKSGYERIQIKLPPIDALNYLSKLLASSCENSPWAIALLTDWSIFASDDDLFLYYQFRKSLGNYDHIIDGPGHLFLNFEYHGLRSLICIAMLNSWDLVVITNTDYSCFKTSHDGFVDIVSCDEEFITSIKAFKEVRNI